MGHQIYILCKNMFQSLSEAKMGLRQSELDRSSEFLSKVSIFLVQSTLFVLVCINILMYLCVPDYFKTDLKSTVQGSHRLFYGDQESIMMVMEPRYFMTLFNTHMTC